MNQLQPHQALIVLLLCLSASVSQAQTLATRQTLPPLPAQDERVESLKTTLEKIARTYRVDFAYDEQTVEPIKVPDRSWAGKNLEETLDQVLKPLDLSFKKLAKDYYVIHRRTDPRVKLLQGQSLRSDEQLPALRSVRSLQQQAAITSIALEKTITGQVTDQSEGATLPGVNIVAKGTTIGSVADIDGNYKITVPDETEVLVFSSVGYLSKEVTIGNQTVINVSLTPDIQSLSEVVVVGYGTQRKSDVTGAVSTISSESIEKISTPNVEFALQGSSPGLQMVSSGGSPEDQSRILIRGTGSVTSGTEPLILVDGTPVSFGGLSFLGQLNPQDVESMTVLRDASATAIYGSRGANGVILITTKSGKKGQKSFSLNYERGVTQPINTVAMAGADEWRRTVETGYANAFPDATDPSAQVEEEVISNLFDARYYERYREGDLYNTVNTDWYDRVIDNGSFDQYSFSASQGFEDASYFISGQYRSQTGNFINEQYDRYQFRANLDLSPSDFMTMGLRYNVSFQDAQLRNKTVRTFNNDNVGDNNFGGFGDYDELYGGALPVYPVVWPGTNEPFDPYSGLNIVHANTNDNTYRKQQTVDHIANLFLELNPFDNLTIRGEVSGTYNQGMIKNYASERSRYNGVLVDNEGNEIPIDSAVRWTGQPEITERPSESTLFQYNLTAGYNTTLSDNHTISALIGFEQLQSRFEFYDYRQQGYQVIREEVEDELTFVPPSDFATTFLGWRHEIVGTERLRSYFGRFNYSFKDRYLAQFTLRRDGSAKFSPKNRFATFPSGSLGWVISDEQFFDFERINFLKLRTSYGTTGNNDIGTFQFDNGYATWPSYANAPATPLNRLGAGKIQWEISRTFDVAVEFGLLGNRLSGSLGYYNTTTDDMLLDVRIPNSLGVSGNNPSSITNIGSLRNQGIELELNSINVDKGGFSWRTDFNISTNRNEILSLTLGDFKENPARFSSSGSTAVLPGEAIGTFFLPEFAGYDTAGIPMIYVIDQERAEEEYVYERLTDESGQDSTTWLTNTTANDNRVLQRGKTGLPTFYGGLTNTLSYKGLTLSFQFTFQGGNYIYDRIGGSEVDLANHWLRAGLLENSWTPENTDAEFPQLYWGARIAPNGANVQEGSTQYLKRAGLVRLRNISMSYELPVGLLEKTFIQGVRVFVNMNNVATFSPFDTFDPEAFTIATNSNRSPVGDTRRNTAQGIFSGVPYFQVFTMSGGVNISF